MCISDNASMLRIMCEFDYVCVRVFVCVCFSVQEYVCWCAYVLMRE